MRYRMLILVAAVPAALALGAFASVRDGDARRYALAEFSVSNLSCGSCVANIRNALEGVDGIGAVQVSVSSGRAKAEYEPGRIDAERIAGRIARAGYPAEVKELVSVDDYRNLREDESRLAARYVGRIGERLISRTAFAEAVARREASGAPPQGGLIKAAWQDLLQRELLLAAAERNQVVVQTGEVDLEIERLRSEEGFEARVASRFGGLDAFRRGLKEEMTIRRNIEQYVLKGENDPLRSRQVLDSWYRELVGATEVTVFDPALKASVEGGGKGCGGCC